MYILLLSEGRGLELLAPPNITSPATPADYASAVTPSTTVRIYQVPMKGITSGSAVFFDQMKCVDKIRSADFCCNGPLYLRSRCQGYGRKIPRTK